MNIYYDQKPIKNDQKRYDLHLGFYALIFLISYFIIFETLDFDFPFYFLKELEKDYFLMEVDFF